LITQHGGTEGVVQKFAQVFPMDQAEVLVQGFYYREAA
jgi:hypothetical protein